MPPVCVTRVPCHPGGRAASGVKYELRVPGRSWRSSSCSLALFPRQGRTGRSARAGGIPALAVSSHAAREGPEGPQLPGQPCGRGAQHRGSRMGIATLVGCVLLAWL